MTRQAVTKHLKLLDEASLVVPIWRGREKLHYLNPFPIREIADRRTWQFEPERLRALAHYKRSLEEKSNAESRFVYLTYIRITPAKLWRALIDPEFTRR
jgi:hypothetical protein